MKHTAAQAGWIVVKAGLGHDVDQVGREQAPQLGVDQVVGGAVVERLARGRQKQPRGGIELAGGDRPQGHVGMGGAALAQVHLDGLHIPNPVDPPGDEIHRVALKAALLSQGFAHGLAMAHQRHPVGVVCGKTTAQVGLAAGTAQDLFMGGQHIHPAARMDRALHAGGTQGLAALKPGFHQGTLLHHQLPPGGRRHRQLLQGRANHPSPFPRREPLQLERFQFKRGIALAAEALIELHHTAP